MKKVFSLIIGRFQPLHDGHKAMIRKVLAEGRNVLIALRDTPIDKDNPANLTTRAMIFCDEFKKEVASGRLQLTFIPDIDEVVYGRDVGWDIREIRLDEETEAISGTKIREYDLDNGKPPSGEDNPS